MRAGSGMLYCWYVVLLLPLLRCCPFGLCCHLFQLLTVRQATSFSIIVEPCLGDVDLYVSQDRDRPSTQHYSQKSVNKDKASQDLTWRALASRRVEAVG